MIGDTAAPLFAAAWNEGIRGFDAETAYEGLRKNALPGGIRDHAGYEHDDPAHGGGMEAYVEDGYVPADIEADASHTDGASMTMEYTYQDWSLAQFARALGREDGFVSGGKEHAGTPVDYGNQPGLHLAHLFNYCGQPWRAQEWVRRVKREADGEVSPHGGYNGDEDQGQMGALSALMAMGLFSVRGGAAVDERRERAGVRAGVIRSHRGVRRHPGPAGNRRVGRHRFPRRPHDYVRSIPERTTTDPVSPASPFRPAPAAGPPRRPAARRSCVRPR